MAFEFDNQWLLVSAFLVLLIQAGFLCYEAGLTQSKHAINVAFKNFADLSLAFAFYWLVGFSLMFGNTQGAAWVALDFRESDASLSAFFLFQMAFCASAATIVSGAIAERTKFRAYILLAVLTSALIYPVFGRWAWGGMLSDVPGWLEARGFVDFAGATVVHGVGGWIALAACLVVGARTNFFERLEAERSESRGRDRALVASNMPLATLGILFFVVGWIGFNGGSVLEFDESVPGIIVNTLLAGVFGGIAAAIYRRYFYVAYLDSGSSLNGVLAGLVAITAGCHVLSTPLACLTGAIGGIVASWSQVLLLRWRIDDVIAAVPAHLVAGVWGTLAVGLMGDLSLLDTGLSRWQQIWVQIEGIVVCGLYSFTVAWLVLKVTNRFTPLRVSVRDEEIGLNVSEHHASTELYKLLTALDKQASTGDFAMRVPEAGHTEVGVIGRQYNRVLDILESTVEQTRLIVRDMRDGILTFSADGVITSLNPGAESILGLAETEAVGQPVENFFQSYKGSSDEPGRNIGASQHDEAAQGSTVNSWLSRLKTMARKGLEDRPELMARRHQGELFPVEVSASVSHGKSGEQFTLALRDISERKEMQEQLRRHAELAQVTLASVKEAVITLDQSFRVVYLNPQAEWLTGCESRDCLQYKLDELVTLTNAEKDPVSLQRILTQSSQAEQRYDLRLRQKDHGVRVVQCSWSPLQDSEGQKRGWVVVLHDVTRSTALQKQLQYQAAHDALTGLLSRQEFENRIKDTLREVHELGTRHALAFLDLDQFKLINDNCGHTAGDEFLKKVGAFIRSQLSAKDRLARLGGDEFGILLIDSDEAHALQRMEALRKAIETFRFFWDERTFAVTTSIGVVPVDSRSHSSVELMSMADAACFASKDLGRNQVHLYRSDDELYSAHRGQMHWASRIQEAIDENRFVLFAQRIVSLQQNPQSDVRIDDSGHLEILLRLKDQDGSFVSPGAFIPAAERYGLMLAVDRWVVRKTLDILSERTRLDLPPVRCAINLSGMSLGDEEILSTVLEALQQKRLDARQLCFEITETAAMRDLNRSRSFIDSLRECGCSFSLDDFGSGLSSFGYLKALPVDYLKIDGQFVKTLPDSEIDRVIVESVTAIAHIMGLRVVAEFVENEAAVALLRSLGVDYAQGFHLHKPQRLEELLGS